VTGSLRDGTDVVRWTHAAFERLTRIASARAGLTFPENRRDIAEAALRRAMHHLGVRDPDVFADRVIVDPRAYAAMLMELTIGETYFFRDPSQWALVRSIIAPDMLLAKPDGRGVRAWSAGCASGEEAHTLAIVLRESGCIDPFVLGTDISEHRIARASRAVYTKWSLRGVDDLTRRRYFSESGQYFSLRPEFRTAQFRTLNLAQPEYGEPGHELFGLDLVLCRNVLIYLDQQSIEGVFTRLVASLRDGGWLLIAASDPQPSAELPLDVVVTEAGLLFRKNVSGVRQAPDLRWPVVAEGAERLQDLPRRITPHASHAVTRAPAPTGSVSSRVDDHDAVRLAYQASRYDAVIALAQDIIGRGGEDAAVWTMLARAQANRGDVTAALRSLARAVERHPVEAELHVVASTLEAQRERYGIAAEAARRAAYLDRNLAVAQVCLGTALMRLGDLAAADRALRTAERLLSLLDVDAIVAASDGTPALVLLNVVRAHRMLIEQRDSRAG
jgi:chemotaxis protein methyltransferase CheR